jgi:hypothetical protein
MKRTFAMLVVGGLLFLSCWGYSEEIGEYPLGRGKPGLAFYAGGQFTKLDRGWDASPSVGFRHYFARRDAVGDGPESLSPWSVELGIEVPHQLADGLTERQVVDSNTYYRYKTKRFGAEHLAVQYRFSVLRPLRMTPDISLGLTLAHFQNEASAYNTSTFAQDQDNASRTVLGPHFRVGLPLWANDVFAFRLDAGYLRLPNHVTLMGRSFDMRFDGLVFSPSIHVSIGHLTSGIQKGVVLPNSALPGWTIAALQTEKRSPIIAPPEVYMNENKSSAGGLSGNVLFQLKNRRAEKVELMGDFNEWKPEPMYIDQAHVWIAVKDLSAGMYHYTYLINGKREIKDPWNTSVDPGQRSKGCSTFVVGPVWPN